MTNDTVNEQILKIIEQKGSIGSIELANHLQINHANLVGNINSIKSLGDVIETESKTVTNWELTEEGSSVAENGSYEIIVFNAIAKAGGMSLPDIMKLIPQAKIGFSKALANKWIKLEKPSNIASILVEKVTDDVKEDLQLIKNNKADSVPDERKQEYKKRKLVRDIVIVSYIITKGSAFTTSTAKPETELTVDLISNGLWKTVTFKPYNFEALGVQPSRGHLHPLMKVRTEFREIFLEMGFTEMPTNKFVESSFWNFDALFQPQQHPARDAHDTFFLSSPKECNHIPADYMEKVAKVHSSGGYGSQGYQYNWEISEAKKNLLRTHTTAVSANMLYKLAKNEKFTPSKFFSIDRVFRNETLDATHLAEFHQVEGVIADYGLTLGDLIGVLYEFFKKLGIEKLKFKPAYNPYTEPSMEIFCYHPGLRKWIEVGNSGMFRPELLLPMGIPPTVNVIAWGLSLERPTMIKYEINNIRELVGPKVSLQMVSENALCRLEK